MSCLLRSCLDLPGEERRQRLTETDPRLSNSATTDFIPNDVALGGNAEQMILLTGPNVRVFCPSTFFQFADANLDRTLSDGGKEYSPSHDLRCDHHGSA